MYRMVRHNTTPCLSPTDVAVVDCYICWCWFGTTMVDGSIGMIGMLYIGCNKLHIIGYNHEWNMTDNVIVSFSSLPADNAIAVVFPPIDRYGL